MLLVLEFSSSFPWVRRHRCLSNAPRQTYAEYQEARRTDLPNWSVGKYKDARSHLTWVRTDRGIGFLHHHEADGYVIQLETGELVKRTTKQFESLPA